jgi:hypothetical protein
VQLGNERETNREKAFAQGGRCPYLSFMSLTTSFMREAKITHPAFRFGFLGFILLLLAYDIYWWATLPATYVGPRAGNLIVGFLLLLNHLAFFFRWPPAVTAALRITAFSWIAFAGFYLYCVLRVIHR